MKSNSLIELIKKLRRPDWLFFATGLLTYLATRLYQLTLLPIFTDEAIYIRWSQIGLRDAVWRFIPLTDGKPPLFHWFMMLTLKLFSDPLFAGRIVSVAAGMANLVLIWYLAYLLFERKLISHLAAILYLASPFMIVYDRLAVVDDLLTTFSLLSLIMAIQLVRKPALDKALILGFAIGGGLLTKATGLFFLIFTPFTLLLVIKPALIKKPLNLLPWLGGLLVAFVTGEGMYAILRLSPFFYRIGQKNSEFLISFGEFFRHPFALTWGNLKSLYSWQIGYLTIPIFILLSIALFIPKHIRPKLVLFVYFLAPLIIIASFNKIIFPRFLLFSTPFLLILAAVGLAHIYDRVQTKIRWPIVLLAIIYPAFVTLIYVINPLKAPIVQADRDQYIDGWSAGFGINETVAYLKNQAQENPIFVGTQGTFGLMPYALEIYLADNPNIRMQSYWPVNTIPEEVKTKAAQMPTYFIYNELQKIPDQPELELIGTYKKGGDWYMRVFKVSWEE
jgi:4-amino-4-deoxy-L-arabinose transferase-like glycosyltransferase